MASLSPTNSRIHVLIADLHGNLRGKWVPATQRDKVINGQIMLPLSTQTQDIWGEDNDHLTGMALSIGDPDGLCIAELSTLKTQPWNPHSEHVLTSMHTQDGEPSFADPRAILNQVLSRFSARGLTPVVAVELEFYLLDSSTRDSGIPKTPAILQIAGAPNELQLYDSRCMDRIEPVLERIHDYARTLSIPAEATLAEFGPGQFEINLRHRDNALTAADDAVLFKRVVDRAALDSHLGATFMAKPYTEHGGSGMHVHVSLLDQQGNNVFDAKDGEALTLQTAVAGLINSTDEAQAVLAPHANSYRRLQPDNFAPVRLDWGYDHRGVAVRLPVTSGPAARLEYRVAGADANPYLVLAVILSGIMRGLDDARPPSTAPLLAGDEPNARFLTHDWLTATERMAESDFMKAALGERYATIYTNIKRHEAQLINRQVTDCDWRTYLPRI